MAVLRQGLVLVAALLVMQGCATTSRSTTGAGDLPAFSQVDEWLYRGGQPSPDGFRHLHRLGIQTVISLRQPSPAMQEERRLVEGLGMRWVNLPMWFWWRPSDNQVRQFLAIVDDPANRPVFVHCRQGWNRAGIMVAVYRVARQGWEPTHAYAEARHFGLVPWNLLTRHLLFYETLREYQAHPSPS